MLVTFQLHDGKGPAGDAIKKVSDGDITHVSIRITTEGNYMPFDFVWEARFGKKIYPILWRDYEYKDSIVRTISFHVYGKNRIEAMLNWLHKQKGKGYDWLGPLSFIWFWIPIRNGKWFCSEFAMVFLMKFIAETERYDQKQTPYGFESIALLIKKFYATQQ